MRTPADKTYTVFQTLISKTMKITDRMDGQKTNTYFSGQYGQVFEQHFKAIYRCYGQNIISIIRMFVRRFSAYLCGVEAIRTKPHYLYRSSIVVVYISSRIVLYRKKPVRSVQTQNRLFLAPCTGNGGLSE